MTEGIDVQLLAAAQVLGLNIYVYDKWGKVYKVAKIALHKWGQPLNPKFSIPGQLQW